MIVPQATPRKAHEILEQKDEAVYLDVRTVEEFEKEHPPGAYNIPVVFFGGPGGQPTPNPDFERIVQAAIPKNRTIIIGCKAGGRSMRAAEIMQSLDYTDVFNMQGGFGGQKDPAGNTIEPGWKDCNLPVESGNPGDRSYEALKKKA